MAETQEWPPSLSKLGRLANGRKFDQLEGAWLRAIEAGVHTPEDLLPIPGQVGRLGEPQRADALVSILLSQVEARAGQAAALEVVKLAAEEMPASEVVRREATRLYRTAHGGVPELEGLLATLVRGDERLDKELALVDTYLALLPGRYVRDREQVVPGRVTALDPERTVVEVEFEGRRQEYGRHHIGRLVPLPPDHFASLIRYEPDRLRELALEQPAELVRRALEAQSDRRLGYRDLKGVLGQLLGADAWSDWWRGARSALRRVPDIEVGGGSQPSLRISSRPRSWEERLREEFDAESEPLGKLDVVFTYLGETAPAGGAAAANRQQADPEFLAHLGNASARIAVAALVENPAVALAGLAAHAEVAERGVAVPRPNPQAAARVLAKLEDPGVLAHRLPDDVLQRTLHYLRRSLPERWPEVWAAVLPRCGRRTCDLAARTLVESGHLPELTRALQEVLARPSAAPEALVWLWRARHGSSLEKELAAIPGASPPEILVALLGLSDAAGRLSVAGGNARHRRTLESVRGALTLQGARPVRDAIVATAPDQAARVRDLIQENLGLPAGLRGQLLGLLRSVHPEVMVAEDQPWLQPVLWSTEDGIRRRQAELEKIVREEIPAVAKQIGLAASFGDLSENSEYTAALEKRDQLASRATTIENDLKIARPIPRDMGAGPRVSVGSKVIFRDEKTGESRTYTFLGPWDADPEHGVLNYDAPMAMAFMGRRVGEEVVYGEGPDQVRWRIENVEAGLG